MCIYAYSIMYTPCIDTIHTGNYFWESLLRTNLHNYDNITVTHAKGEHEQAPHVKVHLMVYQ